MRTGQPVQIMNSRAASVAMRANWSPTPMVTPRICMGSGEAQGELLDSVVAVIPAAEEASHTRAVADDRGVIVGAGAVDRQNVRMQLDAGDVGRGDGDRADDAVDRYAGRFLEQLHGFARSVI